jgi:DNA-directed RNA polymerase subunit M/transcription elongation factor TFIIS
MTQNPLEKLYRHKTFYTTLPSQGRFYSSGIKLSADGELGIMPMSAADEIKLKTPDTLFNGEALFDLFRSTIPDIQKPEEIPVCDVDKLLLGIRVASQGKQLDVKSKCPKCEKTETYAVDLTMIMNSATVIDADPVIQIDDTLEVELRPFTLQSQIKGQIEAFFQQRMQNLLSSDNNMSEEEKIKRFNEALVGAIAMQTTQIAECIVRVTMRGDPEDTIVTNSEHIFAWVENMDSATYEKIRGGIEKLSDPKIDEQVQVKCPACEHEYRMTVNLDPVNFFSPRQRT